MGTDETRHLRASHADREQAIETLKAAFVQGRLDKPEFDARVGRTLASRTYRELAAVTADIPPAPMPTHPLPASPVPAQRPVSRGVKSGLALATVGTMLAASVWAAALSTQNATALVMAMAITVAYAGILLLSTAVVLDSRPQKRGRARRPLAGPPLGQVGIR